MAAFHWFSLFLILSTTIFVNAGRSKRSPIVTNDVAPSGQFRYAVAIVDGRDYVGASGGIIHKRYILTCAHPFVSRDYQLIIDKYAVYAGTTNIEAAKRKKNFKKVFVKTIYIPSNFKVDSHRADIAIFELRTDLSMWWYSLKVLYLPDNLRQVARDERAVVAAFGKNGVSHNPDGTVNVGASPNDGRLRYANIRIVDSSELHGPQFENYTVGPDVLLGRMMKNSTEVYGLCFGDSGAPLVQSSGERNTVIGLNIGGLYENCDGRRYPAIFTKVSNYVPFIKGVISGNVDNNTVIGDCPK